MTRSKTQPTTQELTGRTRGALAVIFLLAGTGLAYEVTLTRLFSVMFQYHYVFLIVSVSIMGLSVGAAMAAFVTRDKRWELSWVDLTYTAVLVAFLLLGAAIVASQLRSVSLMVVVVVAGMLPFVGIGFLNALLFAGFARQGGILYAADLLGGACGLVAALAAVSWFGAFDAIIALAALSVGAASILAWINGQRSLQVRTVGIFILFIAGFLVNRAAGLIAFSPRQVTDAPPDKTLMLILQDPEATLIETRWDSFARVDMVETGDDSLRYVFTDAGAGSIMVGYEGDDQAIAWMQQDVEYLPFTINPEATDNVLILGAGAGRDVLMARLAGADSVTAVEINPALVDLTRAAADYNGNVLDLPGVQTVIADGRTFVERSGATYDLIYANVVYSQAAAPGNSALAESYIFTREALHTYWSHLSDDGRMGFATHHGIEGLRLLIAALDMLQREGLTIQQALEHVALASLRSGDPQTRTSVVIVQRQPWTQDATRAFVDTAHDVGAGVLYMPNYQEIGFEGLSLGGITLDEYIALNADQYNYTPTTDDSPFFYQFTPGLPPGLADLLFVSLLIAFAYLSWLVFFFVRRDGQQWKRASLAPYFAVLGAAFLLVEIPLIQRFNLLLGHPVLALVAVIGALLVGAGLGSLFSSHFPVEKLPRLVTVFGVAIAAVVVLSLVIYPVLIRWALPFDLAMRLIITLVALAPLGFLMGILFPAGLRIANEADPQGVAAFWGANAATAVLGSTLAMVLAITLGFSAVLFLGALLYVAAAGLAHFTWRRLLV
jgi:hypothetical protein